MCPRHEGGNCGTNERSKELDRRNFLKCMAWVGTGAVWTMSSGVLKGIAARSASAWLDDVARRGAGCGSFRSATATSASTSRRTPTSRRRCARRSRRSRPIPKPPAFVLHTGDLTHLSKPAEFDTLQQVLSELSMPVFYVPGRARRARRRRQELSASDSAKGRRAPGGTASTRAASTSSAWSTSST